MGSQTFRQYVQSGGFDTTIYNSWKKDVESAKKNYESYLNNRKTVYDTSHNVKLKLYQSLIDRGNKIKNMISSGELTGIKSNDIDNTISQLGKMGAGVKKVADFYKSFGNADSFYSWSYGEKYKGKSVRDVDALINSLSNSRRFLNQSGNQKELDWLKANRDSFMTRDELLSEIGSLENKSTELKKNKWDNRLDYAGNLIGGAFAGDTSRARSYNTTPETDEIENNARLKKLKELLAGRNDFDAESAYKKADEKNLWDVITTDYTYADYLNDKDSKNIYGKEAVRRRDEENNKIIQSNSDEFSADYSKVASIIAGKKQASAVSSSGVGDLLSGFMRDSWRADEIMKTDPEIQKIIKKWSDKGYDFESLYNSFVKKENADFTEDQRLKQAENTRKNPVLSNIASVGTNVIGGISSLPSVLKTGIENATSDDIVTLDTNAPEWALKNVTDSIRDTTSKMISEKNESIKGEFFNFLYQTGMSIADMGAATLIGGMNPTAMQVIMGTNAGADSIKTVTEKGGSVNEAILTGLTSGIFEALFEKVSIDNLFRTATSDTGKKLIYNFFKGFLSEGSEELCTEIANTFADALINGNNSEFNNSVYNYMAEGKTAAEARSHAMLDTMKQMGLSFAGGALSGGVIAGAGGGVNLLSANRQNAKTGNEIINNGKTDALMDLALKNMNNSEVADNIDAINKYQSRVENKNFRTNGKNEISYAVEHRLADLGVTDSEIANRVTDAYFRGSEYKKTGNKIADKQGARVLSELRSSENATGRENFTNEWAAPVVNKARTDAKTIASEKYRARDIGRLAGSVHNAIIDSTQKNVDAEIKKGIRSRAEELGIDKSTSKTASEIIFNAFMGEKLTMSQNRILQNNPVVNKVYDELKSADEVGIDEEYNNSWVAPVLENTGVMRAEEIAQLSMITPNKGNTADEDGVIDNDTSIENELISTDLNNSSTPKVVNGTVNFDEFVSKTRAEKMNYGVVKKYNKTVIDNKTAGQIAVLDAYGRKHGLSFIVVDSIGSQDDKKANGTYIGKNQMLVSLDSEAGAMLSVAGHEVFHYIAKNDSTAADRIKSFVIDKLKSNDNYNYNERFAELSKDYGTDDIAFIEEEMVANSMFDIISNEDTVNQLSKENPTLLEKIISYVKNFIDEIKNMAKNLPWKEVKVFESDMESLRTINAMAEAALWKIKENGAISSDYANKSTASAVSNNAEKVSKNVENVSNTELNKFSYAGTKANTADYAQLNKKYKSFVEQGNIESAQKFVDEAAQRAGYTIRAYHGTSRGDRVGNVFLPERATSGPMAFFTSSKDIASNYARDKADTSLAYDEEYDDYFTQFRVNHNGESISISDYWNKLSFAEKQRIKEKAKHVTFDDEAENIIYDENVQYGTGGFDAYRLNSNKGNALSALTEEWLVDGQLYGEEHRFLDVLKYVGIENVEYRNPNARHEKVYDTYLKIENPFRTEDVDSSFADSFLEWYDSQDSEKYERETANADMWDKNNITAEEWVENKLRDDIENGTTRAWTMIPDAVTDYLKSLGHDGIFDTGGKGGGESHTVYIPFSSSQIKSAEAVTYDDNGDVISLSDRFDEDKVDIRFSYANKSDTTKNTATDDGVVKYNLQITQDDIRILQTIGRKSINEFTSEEIRIAEKWAKKYWHELGPKSPFFRAWFGDWRIKDTSPVKVVKITNNEYSVKKRHVENNDLSSTVNRVSIIVDENVIKDSLHYAQINGDLNATIKLLAHIDEIIQEAIHLDTQVSHKNKANKKGTTTFMHYLYCPVEYNGAPFIAKITVEEYDVGGKRRAYNAQRIKMSSLPRAHFSQLNNEAKTRKIRLQDDEIMISDLFSLVKQHDKNFKPNPASEIVNEDGTPKVVYHGSYSNFTIFDKNARKHSKSPKGAHFFTDSEAVGYSYTGYKEQSKPGGSGYAGGLYPVYLNIQKPYIIDFKGQVWSEKIAGMDINEHAEYAMNNGYDGVVAKNIIDDGGYGDKNWNDDTPRKEPATDYIVFDSNQIKSATDNIGTFDSSNDDIRFSLQETAKAGETREQLIKENANLRVANKLLKSEIQLTKGNVLPYETAKQIAKNLMKEYSSEYNSNDLAMEIYQIFDYYDGTGDYDYVMNYLSTIGKRVVARSSAVDRTLYEDYDDLRKWIRNMQFTLPEQVVKQLNENYDGKFVSKTFGRMRYVTRATHPDAPFLSQIYSELANEYPNFFSIEDNEYEQPMRLIEFWEKIQPTYYNPVNEMGYASEDEAAVGFAFDVFKAYNNADKHTTFADKKKNEIDKIRKEYDRNLERAKQKLTADRDRRLEWQKEYYINAREKSAEGRKKAYVKKKIRNVINDLDKYLNRGSKEKNVKEGLQDTVQTFLSAAEVLFSDVPTNEDIVRSGVSSFTKKEAEWLDEYASLITKRNELLNKRNEINEMEMSEKFISARENNNKMLETVQKRMHYLDKCLEELFEREKIRVEGATVDEALAKLSVAYTGIRNSEYSYISNSFDENVYNQIESLRESLGGAKISLMSLSQLESVYDVYKMVLHTVRNANKVFTSEKKETAEDLGKIAMKQIREAGGNKKRRVQALEFLKKFGWSELKPIYAFRLIGSEVLRERYSVMRQGEDTYYRDVSHAKEFYAKLRDKYKTDEWKLDKGYEFTSKDGEKFTLTLEQIMSIYAYSRRGEQAVTHLVRGGFVFSDAITVEEKKKGQVIKYKVDDGAAYSLNADILGQINHVLDDNKRAFVEEMQKYLSDVMGDKGNEVSMKMYGVKLFKEKNYFPLKSSAFYRAFDGKVEGEASLKNAGFSKATTPKANNPIVLDDFTNVWSNHVQDMAMYHSFVLPIEDFTKVFNYESHGAEDGRSVSVKATLQGAYGPSAEQYVRNLLTDLNSGVRSQNGTEFVNNLTGLAKKGAVFASASVVVQQPSAVVRATAHVNPKYFINAFPQSANWLKVSKEFEELKKYAPVAGIKEMGYFDTGLGKSTAEWITEKEYRGFGKKFKALVSKDGKYRDEVFSMLAGKADEVSWVYIWNAVKKEVAEKQHLSGDALLNAAGKRFTEVIELTQVYDSVFSRSGLMRSKDTGVKMVTSFMAEPTTQVNMLFDALFVQGKRGNKKYTAAAVGAVYASILVNAMLKSIVTAGRDDEDEFSYTEKYISNLISSFITDGTIVSSIPFARDIISLVQGYDVERMDMTVIADVINSFRALQSDKMTTFEKISGVASSILAVFGIPAKNILKDMKMIYNTYQNIANGYEFSPGALGESNKREITGKSTPKADLLYNAIVSGDTEYAGRLKKGFTESGYNSAVREGLKKYDSRIYDAAVARMNGNTAEYMRLAKEIIAEGNFSQDNIVSAIISTINSLSVAEDKPKEEKTESIFTDEDYFDAVVGGDGKTADIVGKDLVETDVANGKTQEDAEKSLVSSLRNNVRDAFEAGELDFAVSKNILVKYGDMTDSEADNKLRYWDFVIEYPDITLDEEIVIKYYNDIEPSGISVDLYYEYYVNQKACKGEKDSEGKTISGSKKEQIMKVIDALPISAEQKDLLYFQNNWTESKLHEAPWH